MTLYPEPRTTLGGEQLNGLVGKAYLGKRGET